MHIVLNFNKTAWAVWVGVPHWGGYGTTSRLLAIIWSFCLNALMISGLGELVSSFMFQALSAF